jgi:hypothetical protein
MWLEDYIPSEWVWESGWASAEQVKEASEQYKKQAAKSAAWIKRTQKDEKKAKAYDMLLAGFLVKILVNQNYDVFLDSLFNLLHKWYPSNFVLWVISLIYPEVSNKIRELSNKELIIFNYKSQEQIVFNDSDIDIEIKNRINWWIEDIVDSVSIEYSSILTKRLINFLETDDDILLFISKVFTKFLNDINISIDLSKSQNISEFIIKEVLIKVKNLDLEDI